MLRLLLVAVALCAAALTCVSPASAATRIAPHVRPHSRVVTYDHGVRVSRLQLTLRRHGHVLRGRIVVSAASTTGHTAHRVLRVGSCTGGPAATPVCPAARSFTIRATTKGVTFTRLVTLPLPRAGAVEARLVRRGASPRAFYSRGDAELLVRSRAWTGATAGHAYGVVLPTYDEAFVGRIVVDGPAQSADSLYAYVIYTAGGSALGTPETTVTRSPPPDGDTGTVLKNHRGSGPTRFGDRFVLRRRGASAFGVQVRGAGRQLARVWLPWPVG